MGGRRRQALVRQVRKGALSTQTNRDSQWLHADRFSFIFNFQTGMLSLKMKMGSSHSQKWLGPMIPQSRDRTNGDWGGAAGRQARCVAEDGSWVFTGICWPISARSREANGGSELTAVTDIQIRVHYRHKHCATYCNTISFRFCKVLAKSL